MPRSLMRTAGEVPVRDSVWTSSADSRRTGVTQIASLGAALLAERGDLAHFLTTLHEEEWYATTPPRGWIVLDVVTHLAYFDDALRLAIDAPSASGPPPLIRNADFCSLVDAVVAEFRTLPPRSALTWLLEAGRVLVASSASVDPFVSIPGHGVTTSLCDGLNARILETWAHGQDVYDAVARRRPWSPRLHYVADVGVTSLARSFNVHGLERPTAPVRVELEGWVNGPIEAANRVSGSLEDFCLLVTNRRRRQDLDLVATGPVAEKWLGIAQVFPESLGAVCVRADERGHSRNSRVSVRRDDSSC